MYNNFHKFKTYAQNSDKDYYNVILASEERARPESHWDSGVAPKIVAPQNDCVSSEIMKALKFCGYSFGCRVNQAEKEEIDKQILRAGFIYDEKQPDIFIINTCAVTQKAEREARQLIYQLKEKHPQSKIVITGCAATYWQKNNLYQNLPTDLLVDNINKEFLVSLLSKRLLKLPEIHRFGGNRSRITGQKQPFFDKFINSGRVLIKIQDGCHQFCSFCIVPYLRGLPKSVKINNIVGKINRLKQSVKEVILTAINTEAYGHDTKETFTDMIYTIIRQTKIPRLSFGSIHAFSINSDFLNLYKNSLPFRRLVNFFHIPIQSGSNQILNLMKRGYTIQEIIEIVNSIYRLNKKAFISGDVIVGFLGESDKNFEETYNFLKKNPIVKFHIFRFSKRIGTAAYFMSKKIKEPPEKVKKERAGILKRLSEEKWDYFKQSLVGYTSPVLFLAKKKEDFQEGLLDNQITAWIKTSKDCRGEIKNVKIISFKNERLFGKII